MEMNVYQQQANCDKHLIFVSLDKKIFAKLIL